MSEEIIINKDGKDVVAKGKELEYLLEWQTEAHLTYEALQLQVEQTETAKESALAKLAKLGLTPEEIAAL